jgi:hypothetical protein
MRSKAYIAAAAVVFLLHPLLAAPGAETLVFDGAWWRSVDHHHQLGFVHGYIDCDAYIHPGPALFNRVPLEDLQDKVTAYYDRFPDEIQKPVAAVLRTVGGSDAPATGKSTLGVFDGEDWRQGGTHFRQGFVQGYLSCLESVPKLRERFTKSSEWYVREISKWYGVEDGKAGAINPKRSGKPIGQVLFLLEDKPLK